MDDKERAPNPTLAELDDSELQTENQLNQLGTAVESRNNSPPTNSYAILTSSSSTLYSPPHRNGTIAPLNPISPSSPTPLFSKSHTLPINAGVWQNWSPPNKGSSNKVVPVSAGGPDKSPQPPTTNNSNSTSSSPPNQLNGNKPAFKPPAFARTGSMVNVMNPDKNYIVRKNTKSLIERPSKWQVFLSCIQLVIFLMCTGVIAVVPCIGFAFFDASYSTPNGIIPYCDACRSGSEALTIFVLCSYPFFLLVAIYGWEKAKFLWKFNLIYVALQVSIDAVLFKFVYSAQLLVTYVLWAILLGINGWLFGRRHGLEKTYVFIFVIPFGLEAMFLLLNDMTIIPSFLTNPDVVWRTFVRNILNPVYYAVLVLLLRYCAKRMHSDRAVVITLVPLFLRSFFGRIFNSEMAEYELVVLNSFLSVMLDIVVRLVHWNRWRVFKVLNEHFPNVWNKESKALKWIFDTPEGDVFYGQFLNYEKAQEIIGILFSIALSVIHCIYTDDYTEMLPLFWMLVIQLVIEFFGQIVVTLLEYYFNVPVLNSTRHFREFMPIFMFSSFVGATFCGIRGYRIITGTFPLSFF